MKEENQIVIYQSTKGSSQVEVQFDGDTIWLSLNQISELFGRDKSVISRHIRSIFNENELDKKAVVAKNATAQSGLTHHLLV